MTTLLTAVVAVLLLGLAVGLVRLHPRVVFALLSLYVLTAWEFPNFGIIGTFGGTTVSLADVASAVLLISALMNWRTATRNLTASQLISGAVIVVVLVVSLLRGVRAYGLGEAANEFRTFFYVAALISWAITMTWSQRDVAWAAKFFTMTQGIGLCLLTLYHVARYGFGGASDFVDLAGDVNQTGRPLVSGQAFELVLCAVLALWIWSKEGKRAYIRLFFLFVAVAIASQQRTVWLVVIGVVLILVLRGPAALRARLLAFGACALLACAVIVVADPSSSSLVTMLEGSASNAGTYDARVNSWHGLVTQSFAEGPLTVLFGAPFGHGFVRFEGVGRLVSFAPHNWYVTVYLRIGLVGLVAMLAVLVPALIRGLVASTDTYLTAVLFAFLIYGWTYSWPWYCCFALALCFVEIRTAAGAAPEDVVTSKSLVTARRGGTR